MQHCFVTNRNGDTPETLKKEFLDVLRAARALEAALAKVTVHGRNYQTLHNASECLDHDANQRRYMANSVRKFREWAEAGAARAIDQAD